MDFNLADGTAVDVERLRGGIVARAAGVLAEIVVFTPRTERPGGLSALGEPPPHAPGL